jgi:hypothetical protein
MQFSMQAHDFGYKLLPSREINISTLDIRAQQLHPKLIPNIHSLLPVRQQSLYIWLQHANEGAVWSHSRNDRIEHFPDSVGHCDRRNPLRHFPLNLPRRVFFCGTVGGDCGQLIV